MDSSDNESIEETPEKMLSLSTDTESNSNSYYHKDTILNSNICYMQKPKLN